MVDSIDDPSDKDYITVSGDIISSKQHNNPEKKTEVKKLCRRLKILREVIAYKSDDREFMDHMLVELSFNEALPVEFTYYQNQTQENLWKHEERLVRDLATLGYDASRDTERAREDLTTDRLNEAVDLNDDDDSDDGSGDQDQDDSDDDIDYIG